MLLQVFELAANQALEHDPAARAKLAALEGKVIVLEIKTLNQKIVILPQRFGVELQHFEEQQATVLLAATPKALIEIARHGMQDLDLEAGELEISGDPIVAQKFAALAASLDIDWEGLLAEHLGELPASYIARGVNAARTIAEEGSVVVKSHLNKTLVKDMELVAESTDVENFLEGVDELRAAVDQLEARLKRVLRN